MENDGFFHKDGAAHVAVDSVDAYPNMAHAGHVLFRQVMLVPAKHMRTPVRKEGEPSGSEQEEPAAAESPAA